MALKVIGAGLGRTGTLSLKLALEHIGFGPCYHMMELMGRANEHLPKWIEVVRGNPDWDAVFDGFVATVDYPSCNYWRELADHYPDAKVILSTRDAEGWFNSVSRTIFSPGSIANMRQGPFAEFMEGAVLRGIGDRVQDRDFMENHFREWEASVIAGLPSDRLLVHRPGDGWEPLCSFLDVPIPDVAYPKVNSSEDMLGKSSNVAEEATLSPQQSEGLANSYIETMRRKAFGDQG